MNEREQSQKIATMWLDFRMNPLTQMIQGDPDCDACVLARSYLRALEKIERMKAILQSMSPSQLSNFAIKEISDEWPGAIQ